MKESVSPISKCDFHYNALTEIRDDVKTLHSRLSKMGDILASIDKTLSVQSTILDTHVAGTVELRGFSKQVELRVSKLEEIDKKARWAFNTVASIFGFIVSIIVIIGVYFTYLTYIKDIRH